jgi:hypothetical protein
MIAPRVLIVMPDQWRRAMLRAALREVGYDAVGVHGLREAREVRPIVADRGPVGLAILDQQALIGCDRARLDAVRQQLGAPPTILLARATVDAPVGTWTKVLRRPVSVGDILTAVEALLPLAAADRHPID